ncbi:MAG: carbohydrate-binding protein, partial [Bacteroidota bacterium]
PANTTAFYTAWLANHLTKRDIDSLASWGFNSVRLPMHYNLFTLPIEQEPVPGNQTWLDQGFALTDSLVKWCSANHIYVILDLHAAPGGQGKDYAICDGDPSKTSLWDSFENKQKTIALWKKLAQRYASEPWVGGYDLINEPNWSFTSGGNQNGCSESSNAPLRQLLMDITSAIRQVDANHMIIIEGNCWGNNYNGILPAWDLNMALSYHKYWSFNDQNSIQGMLNMRTQYNLPVWLGESGENSNVWFTEAITLFEKNKIGWAWWPLKKINSVVCPFTIIKTPEYQTLLDYWTNGGAQPSITFATNALMQMATNANASRCIFRKDVPDAMFRQIHDSTTKPFANHLIPGIIHATDFDLGRCGSAYWDSDTATFQVSTGNYTAWNTGWSYRNDAVDIEPSNDPSTNSNGFDVGWTADKEWMQYSAQVDSSAAYNIQIHYSAPNSSSMMIIKSDNVEISPTIALPSSGGYQNWTDFSANDLILYKGSRKIRLYFDKGGANLGYLKFILSKRISDVPLKVLTAGTYQKVEDIEMTFNKILIDSTVSPQGFSASVNGITVNINSLVPEPGHPYQGMVRLGQTIVSGDIIKISYSGNHVKATDGTLLENFSNLEVKNNLPSYLSIPGKIEAENFAVNSGLKTETCTDTGGGLDVGFTDPGDYLEYNVKVLKTALYNFEIRVACLSKSGAIEVQQINGYGAVVHSATLTIPVTGGWQTWQTINKELQLDEGVSLLRIKILQPEFNMNWYKFTEKGLGIYENEPFPKTIFPNPAKNEITIALPGSIGQEKSVIIYNLNGKVLKDIPLSPDFESEKIDFSTFEKGFYLIEIRLPGLILHDKLLLE